MKVIVTGGRHYSDADKVWEWLNRLDPSLVIHGDCSGADTIAKNWAVFFGIEQKKYPYPREHGNAGGPIRNRKMIDDNPEAIIVAFPGGKGTKNCTDYAFKQGRIVIEAEP